MVSKSGVTLTVIGYIVFFFCMEGWGADWKFIGIDVQGTLKEINMASISHRPNNIVRVWEQTTFSEIDVNKFVKKLGSKYKDLAYAIALYEYDCAERKTRSLSSTFYSLGEVISSESSSEGWSFIVPDSVAEAVFKEVCK